MPRVRSPSGWAYGIDAGALVDAVAEVRVRKQPSEFAAVFGERKRLAGQPQVDLFAGIKQRLEELSCCELLISVLAGLREDAR